MNKGDTFGENGRYVVDRLLGTGGMGAVFLAKDTRLKRDVAIKMLHTASGMAAKELLQRLKREAAVLGRLNHPSLAEVFEVDIEVAAPYIVQEYIRGEDLERRLHCGDVMSSADARKLAKEMAEALEYLHENKILHRDIKPANVFEDINGKFRLMDFGLVLPIDETRLTETKHVVGTAAFLAPEVLMGEGATTESDIYQVGLLLHYMLTNRNLHGLNRTDLMTMFNHLAKGDWQRPELDENIPEDLYAIIDRCCQFDPALRPKDGKALIAFIESVKGRSKKTHIRKTQKRPQFTVAATPIKEKSTNRKVIVALLSLFFVLVCTAIWLASSPPKTTPTKALRKLNEKGVHFAALPDGFILTLPGNWGIDLQWQLLLGSKSIATGTFERRGGRWVASGAVAKGPSELILLVSEDKKALARHSFILPRTVLKKPIDARFGLSQLHLNWQLHGSAPVDVTVLLPTGDKLNKSGVERNNCSFRFPRSALKGSIRYRLALQGKTIAEATGRPGLTSRFTFPHAHNIPGRECHLEGDVTTFEDTVVIATDRGYSAALTLAPTPEGLLLRPLWFYGTTLVRTKGYYDYRTTCKNGEGGVVIIANTPNVTFTRLSLAHRKTLWQTLVPQIGEKLTEQWVFSRFPSPALYELDESKEWRVETPGHSNRPFMAASIGKDLVSLFVLGSDGEKLIVGAINSKEQSFSTLHTELDAYPLALVTSGSSFLGCFGNKTLLAIVGSKTNDGSISIGKPITLSSKGSAHVRAVTIKSRYLVAKDNELFVLKAFNDGTLVMEKKHTLPIPAKTRVEGMIASGEKVYLMVTAPGTGIVPIGQAHLLTITLTANGAIETKKTSLGRGALRGGRRRRTFTSMLVRKNIRFAAIESELLVVGSSKNEQHRLACTTFVNTLFTLENSIFGAMRNGTIIGLEL